MEGGPEGHLDGQPQGEARERQRRPGAVQVPERLQEQRLQGRPRREGQGGGRGVGVADAGPGRGARARAAGGRAEARGGGGGRARGVEREERADEGDDVAPAVRHGGLWGGAAARRRGGALGGAGVPQRLVGDAAAVQEGVQQQHRHGQLLPVRQLPHAAPVPQQHDTPRHLHARGTEGGGGPAPGAPPFGGKPHDKWRALVGQSSGVRGFVARAPAVTRRFEKHSSQRRWVREGPRCPGGGGGGGSGHDPTRSAKVRVLEGPPALCGRRPARRSFVVVSGASTRSALVLLCQAPPPPRGIA